MAPSGSTTADHSATNGIGDASTSFAALNKRILPSRVRRGGPGVGQNDIDQMILETYEREQAAAIIPEATKFILTTDSKLVPPMIDNSTRPDLTKYFSRPEIMNSLKMQRQIQTPEFTPLSQMSAVGSRLRVRGEENIMDMSDEAYLRRHRRYEAFEKKQRRREKEKLVHEQYKLRQRLDELRGFDINAFAVSGLPQETTEQRRKIMLDTAEALDRRYATLLPPDPKRTVKRRAQSVGPSIARTTMAEDPQAPPPQRRRGGTPAPSRARRELELEASDPTWLDVLPPHITPPKPKAAPAKKSGAGSASKGKGKSTPKAKAAAAQATPKLTIKLPARSDAAATATSPVSDGGPPSPIVPPDSDTADQTYEPIVAARVGARRLSAPGVGQPPRKRARTTGPSLPARLDTPPLRPSVGAHGVPVLLAAARRNAQPKSRRTSRVPEPFGVKLPRSVEEDREFEIPFWAHVGYVEPEPEDDDLASVDGPPVYEGELTHGPPPDIEMEVDEDEKN